MIPSPSVPSPSPDAPFQGRWAVALRGGEEGEVALHELLRAFWYPVYAFFRRHQFSPEAAAVTLEHLLAEVRGEFPAIELRASSGLLRKFLLERAERAVAQPPITRTAIIQIDREWAEHRFAKDPPKLPEELFLRRWGLTIVEFTLANIATEFAEGGRFAALRPVLGYSASNDQAYVQLAQRLGLSVSAARKAVYDFRTRYRELLRAQIADTVASAEQVDDELTALLCVL